MRLNEIFLTFGPKHQEDILAFVQGNKGLPILYDSFFKYVFDPERHPERLEDFLSEVLIQMDKNTVQYMIEEQQKELEKQQKELADSKKELEKQRKELEDSKKELEKQYKELEDSKKELEDKDRKIAELQRQLEKMSM